MSSRSLLTWFPFLSLPLSPQGIYLLKKLDHWFYGVSYNCYLPSHLCGILYHIPLTFLFHPTWCIEIKFNSDTNCPELVHIPQVKGKGLHKTPSPTLRGHTLLADRFMSFHDSLRFNHSLEWLTEPNILMVSAIATIPGHTHSLQSTQVRKSQIEQIHRAGAGRS